MNRFSVSFLLLVACLRLTMAYDYYTFALEVPQVACDTHSCTSDNEGNIGPKTLNIHGLWPSASDGNHPFNCKKNIYNATLLQPSVKSAMDANWVGLYNSTFWFRWHEYGKHGTCFQETSYLRTQIASYLRTHESRNLQDTDQIKQMNDFFQKALDLKAAFNLESIIFSASKFAAADLKSKIRTSLGANDVLFDCSNSNNGKTLFTIEICLDLTFKPVDCSSVRNNAGKQSYQSSCPDDGDITVETFGSS